MKLHIQRPSHRKRSRRKGLQAMTKTKAPKIFIQLPVQNLNLELELKTKDILLLVKKQRWQRSAIDRGGKINHLLHIVKSPKYLSSLPWINIHSVCISHIWEQKHNCFLCLVVQCNISKKILFCPLYHRPTSWFGEEFMAVI